VQPSTVPHER